MSASYKSECPAATGQNAEQSTDTRSVTPAFFLSNEAKEFATLRAQFAMRGHELHAAGEGYVVSRWNLSRFFTDLQGVEAFAQQIGGDK